MTAGLLAAQPGGWTGAPSGAAVPDAWPPSGDAAFAGLLPGYAFAQVQDTPPTFVSSILNATSGALAITFSEDIDVTPATNVVPAKMHVRESGNYTGGGITLSAGELSTTADGTTISFALNASRLAAVAALGTPELTIEPGAVQDTSGDLIEGTFDASTRSFVDSTSVSGQEGSPTAMAFSNDGTKMFVAGNSGNDVNEYALTTAFDASTLSFTDAFAGLVNQDNNPTAMAFSNDGTRMFVVGIENGAKLHEYTLPAFDVSDAVLANTTSISEEATPTGIAFSNDGTKMFVVGSTGDDVNEYALSVPFNATTRTFVDATSISDQEINPQDIAFSNDGTKMFVIGLTGDDVNEYALTTPFDASTRSFVDATSISDQELTPRDVEFSSDGSKMFVIGSAGDDVNEYALSSVYPIAVVASVPPPDAFVTTWETASAGETITIPVRNAAGNYTVHWGDGNSTTHVTDATHTYAEAGNHTVSISGNFTQIRLTGDATNAAKLQSIDRWGNITWTTMKGAFRGASNMAYDAADTPDLSGVASMESMFRDTSFSANLSGWNVSQVTDTSRVFQGSFFNGGHLGLERLAGR